MTHITARANRPIFAVNGSSTETSIGAQIWAWIVRRRRVASDRRYLQSLPDEMLHDIGIGRSKIQSVTKYGRAVNRH